MKQRDCVSGFFYEDASPLKTDDFNSFPVWGMSLKLAGSMRFRWNEVNENRAAFLRKLSGDVCGIAQNASGAENASGATENASGSESAAGGAENASCAPANTSALKKYDIAAVELVHSKTVFAVDSIEELYGKQGDGIITTNRNLIPVITVADCMPIFLFEPESGVFGVLHSGWRGTGIVKEAIEKAEKVYGASREKFTVVMGPHIHSCCYTVDEERANYFRVNFGASCVTPVENEILGRTKINRISDEKLFSLSLADANLNLLRSMGVHENNIVVCRYCTCCNSEFGSFRRETFGLPADMSMDEKQKHFTVQAAWVKW